MSADNCLLLFSAQGIIGYNLFAYCGNDPINHVDPNGNEWWHWAIAGCVVIALVAASIVTCGGAAVAAATAAAVVTDTCAVGVSTTAVVVTGAAVGTAIGFAGSAAYAASTVESLDELADYGEQALIITSIGAAAGAAAGYLNASLLCFAEGTRVATESGLVSIEKIQPGDLVWAYNEETGETELKVARLFRNETNEWIHLTAEGEELVCTPEHPFYSPVKGWTAACKLRAGDILVALNGEYVVLEKIQHELLESSETTYNFEVKGFHTYYVGDTQVLVHNMCAKKADI